MNDWNVCGVIWWKSSYNITAVLALSAFRVCSSLDSVPWGDVVYISMFNIKM